MPGDIREYWRCVTAGPREWLAISGEGGSVTREFTEQQKRVGGQVRPGLMIGSACESPTRRIGAYVVQHGIFEASFL